MEIVFLCLIAFFAALVDAIAGGGGILTIPSLLAVGIPPHLALGTNKFSASWGSFTSSFTFFKSKKIYLPLIKYVIPFTFLGASLGVNTALKINQQYLKMIVLIMLFLLAIYTSFKKDIGIENKFTGLNRKKIIIGCIIGFLLGFYDGFFGPGTGSFLLFAFIRFFGFNFTISTANAKILNFTSNLTSLILFALHGKIIYSIGIPMAISTALGARLGSKIAIKHGSKIIKPIFVTMSMAMVVNLLIETF
ncbi:MAG: hypothetical protein FH762_10000 [Firmicutes bacterium]|nr:hypothetical protein [Bacillota bacterium]